MKTYRFQYRSGPDFTTAKTHDEKLETLQAIDLFILGMRAGGAREISFCELTEAREETVSDRFNRCRAELRRDRKFYQGLRVIDFDPHATADVFPQRTQRAKTALENLDKQPADAFRVFVNLNGEIVVQQIRKLPFFHLV